MIGKDKILVIEDEESILELVRYNLAREGLEVLVAETGEAGLRIAQRETPSLIVLDLMLPDISGLEVCRRIRGNIETASTPVIMLTAKGEEADVVSGLEVGADDYVIKPFSPRVLIARVNAQLRRDRSRIKTPGETLSVSGLAINPNRHLATVGSRSLELTKSEFSILHLLAQKPGWVFSRDKIVDAVHGEDYPVTERSVDVQIAGLRKKLKAHGTLIETVRGVGYRFKDVATAS